MKESTLATIAGAITALGIAWAVFAGAEYELPIVVKMLIISMPVVGGLLTKSFHKGK